MADSPTRHRLQPRTWSTGSLDLRFAGVETFFRGRSVLDLGAAAGFRRPDWVHLSIASVASELVGVDLNPNAVSRANERHGTTILVGDAETVRLGRKFDVVFAGELIEHLPCPRALLETALAHLEPQGRFIVTTPNAFAVSNFVYRLGAGARVHPEHVAWYCRDTLRSLLERSGFAVERIEYLRHRTPGTLRALAASIVRAPLPDQLAWNTLLVVAQAP